MELYNTYIDLQDYCLTVSICYLHAALYFLTSSLRQSNWLLSCRAAAQFFCLLFMLLSNTFMVPLPEPDSPLQLGPACSLQQGDVIQLLLPAAEAAGGDPAVCSLCRTLQHSLLLILLLNVLCVLCVLYVQVSCEIKNRDPLTSEHCTTSEHTASCPPH